MFVCDVRHTVYAEIFINACHWQNFSQQILLPGENLATSSRVTHIIGEIFKVRAIGEFSSAMIHVVYSTTCTTVAHNGQKIVY